MQPIQQMQQQARHPSNTTTQFGLCTPPSVRWLDATPCQRDVYYNPTRGLEESRHVYIEGNRLRQRFAQVEDAFVLGEVGFGTGLNFLAIAQAWQKHAKGGRLVYVAFEPYPLSASQLAHANRQHLGLESLTARLTAIWPPLICGSYHLDFAEDIRLVLHFLPIQACRHLQLGVHAWCYDAFAPSIDPQAWDEAAMDSIAAWSYPGTSLASYSVACRVRRALTQRGFACVCLPGFGTKHEMLRAVLSGGNGLDTPFRHTHAAGQSIGVIGGGLAGIATAVALARQGARVTLLERRAHLAGRASRHTHAVFYARLPWLASDYQRWIWYCYCAGWSTFSCLHRFFRPMPKCLLAMDAKGKNWLRGWQQAYRSRAHVQWLGFPDLETGMQLLRCGTLHKRNWCEHLAQNFGAGLMLGTRVDGIKLESTRVLVNYTRRGAQARQAFDQLVVAANAATSGLTGISPDLLQLYKGQVHSFAGASPSQLLGTNRGYCAPGKLGADFGGRFERKFTSLRPDAAQGQRIRCDVQEILPKNMELPSTWGEPRSWADLRSTGRDHLPLVGQAAPRLWLNTGYGGKGSLAIAPTSELLVQHMCGTRLGAPVQLLEQLDPLRWGGLNMRC